jgi:hypothetical protein
MFRVTVIAMGLQLPLPEWHPCKFYLRGMSQDKESSNNLYAGNDLVEMIQLLSDISVSSRILTCGEYVGQIWHVIGS